MRFHSDTLTFSDIYDAAREARVGFYKLDEKRSHSRNRAWVIRLEGWHSNRLLNFGDGYTTAATWDEWGIFLGFLFRRDPQAHCDNYKGLRDFQIATGNRFDTLRHADQHTTHRWVSDCERAFSATCKCGARQIYYRRPKVIVDKHRLIHVDRIDEIEAWIEDAALSTSGAGR